MASDGNGKERERDEGSPPEDPSATTENIGKDEVGEEQDERYCFFCGTLPEGSRLIEGVHGPICSSCVFSLGARLVESDRDVAKKAPRPRTIEEMYAEEGDLPAHEYQNRVDLAAAYVELGKKSLALKELFAAFESSLICQDWVFALKIIPRIRDIADGPTLRDRIHETLAIHVPRD